jgi:hypothetical protein
LKNPFKKALGFLAYLTYSLSKDLSKKRIPFLFRRFLFLLNLSLFSVPPVFGQGINFLQNGQPTPTGTDIGVFLDTQTRHKIDLA